jgi:hypothetical protein
MQRQVAARRIVALGIAADAPLAALACTPPPQGDPAGPAAPPPAVKPAKPAFAWYSELGDTVIAKCDAILTGRVGPISELRGGAVVRIDVEHWFDGEPEPGQTEVTVLAHPDDFFTGTRLLLFLQRYESRGRYTYLNRILESDPDFEPKRRLLEQTLALRDLKSDEERRYAVRRRIYEEAGSIEPWTRAHVLRELAYLRKAWPDLLTRDDLADLRELAKRSADEKWKKALLAAIEDKERNS